MLKSVPFCHTLKEVTYMQKLRKVVSMLVSMAMLFVEAEKFFKAD